MRRVLVVEDSVSARAFVRAVLEEATPAPIVGAEGYEVLEANGGFDAMRLLPRGPYDLIITDINMADINGLELIRFIRQSAHHGTTPLLVISSMRATQDVERALLAGANEYLAKPFTAEQLREACDRTVLASRAAGAPRTSLSDRP